MGMKLTIGDEQLIAEVKRTLAAHPKNEGMEFYVRWIITRGAGPIELSST